MIYSFTLHIALQLTATLSHYGAEQAFKFNFNESINSLHPSGLWLCRAITRPWSVTLNTFTFHPLSLHHGCGKWCW